VSLTIRPCTLKQAQEYITLHHRHHKRPVGWKFGISCWDDDVLVGVIVVSRPTARMSDDGLTAEVTRCCTDGTKNACSMLYGAAWRASKAMGYHTLITYILDSEQGTSLRAAGWTYVYTTRDRPKGWDTPSRRREVHAPTEAKQLWRVGVAP
jgi:hypothetical protein